MRQKIAGILKKPFSATLISIFFGFVVAAIVLAMSGCNPFEAFSVMFQGVFSKPKYIANVVIKATPLILTAVSIAFAFKVGLFNIGAEGQFIIGTVAATIVGILVDLPAVIELPLVIICGMVAGAIYGGFVGFLKAKFGIHEVITSIMLNWIAFYLCNFIVNTEKFHQPNSTSTFSVNPSAFDPIYNWKKSDAGKEVILSNEFLREAVGKTSMNTGIIIAVIVAILVAILLKKTTKGFELRAVGMNPEAARVAGINVNRNIVHAMLIAGAVAGLAGALQITGVSMKISTLGSFENYGFNGMSVALIASSSPIGSIFAGFLFAGLIYGGGSIQSELGAPSEVINIMIGTIVFFVALSKVIPVLADRLGREVKKDAK